MNDVIIPTQIVSHVVVFLCKYWDVVRFLHDFIKNVIMRVVFEDRCVIIIAPFSFRTLGLKTRSILSTRIEKIFEKINVTILQNTLLMWSVC